MINRSQILDQAMHNCLVEMYKWAQPSIDLNKLLDSGFKDSLENPLYKRHYLSQENFIYLRDSFKTAYGIVDNWDYTFSTLIDYLVKGGLEDDYKPSTKDRPGYRDYKKVPPINTIINNEDTQKCLTYIDKCRKFYKGHSIEVTQFNISISLGGSPNSNKDFVQKYWKNNGYPEFTIVDHNIENIIYGFEDENLDISEEDFIKNLKSKTPNIYEI